MTDEPQVRRVYEPVEQGDGVRVLVDRLWPRGLSKENAALDDWAKDAAPSSELRRWYGHKVDRFPEFARRYRTELTSPEGQAELRRLLETADGRQLTLLTATRDVEHSGAVVLADELHRFTWAESG